MGEPGRLAVLDLEKKNSKLVSKTTRYYPETANDNLVMSWAATKRPSGFKSLARGVAFVRTTRGYSKSTYQSDVPTRNNGYFWREPPAQAGVMLILILPAGYVISAVDKTDPNLVETKAFKNRMALYWLEYGQHDIDFTWDMEESPYTTEEQLEEFCSKLNEEAYQLRKQSQKNYPQPVKIVSNVLPHQNDKRPVTVALTVVAGLLTPLTALFGNLAATKTPPSFFTPLLQFAWIVFLLSLVLGIIVVVWQTFAG